MRVTRPSLLIQVCAVVLSGLVVTLAVSVLAMGQLHPDAVLTATGIAMTILAGSLPDLHKKGAVEANGKEALLAAAVAFAGILAFSLGSYRLFLPSPLLLPLWATFPLLLAFDAGRRFVFLMKSLDSKRSQ